MKKAIILSLILILTLSAAACSQSTNMNTISEAYVTPDSVENTDAYIGVFRLDTSRWSEESLHKLFHVSEDDHNAEHSHEHSVYLSIAPDGTAYLQCGSEITEGRALVYNNPENIPDSENMYQFTFGENKSYANLESQILTVDDMGEYTDINDMQGTTWTFIYENDNWWTLETLSKE